MWPLETIGGDNMEAHIVAAMEELGVVVHTFPMYGTSRTANRVRKYLELAMTDMHWISSTPVERSLIKTAKAFCPDLVMVLLGNYTPPSTIQKVRNAAQAPVVCWCQDHMGSMGRQYIIGSHFDYLFAKDQVMVDRFRRYTTMREVHYLAEACNPLVHTPASLNEDDMRRFNCEVTTAGSLYYFRAEILAALSTFDLKIWGAVPKYHVDTLRQFCTGEPVFMRDKAACFNAAKIVINTLFPLEMKGLNARAFEIAGCGGFQLISESDVLAQHFIPGKEIETYGNIDELQHKVRYYLAHDSERRAISDAGRRRAHAEHTYIHRLKEMFDIIGLKLPASEAGADSVNVQ